MRSSFLRVTALAVALVSCTWELLPPTGYDDAGRATGVGPVDSGSVACGQAQAPCCSSGSLCRSGLACIGTTCAAVSCGGIQASCSSASTCCGNLACSPFAGRSGSQCCLGVGQACDPSVPRSCCGDRDCADPGDGHPVCFCAITGGSCSVNGDCCRPLSCGASFRCE